MGTSHPADPAIRVSRADAGSGQRLNDLERQLQRERHTGRLRPLRPGPAHAGVVAVLLAAAWLVAIFGRSLTDLDAAQRRAAALAAEREEALQRVAAVRAEVALVQSEPFLRLQARAYGLGEPGERVFALEAGAPESPTLVPLGAPAVPPLARTPLEDWLALLFGD